MIDVIIPAYIATPMHLSLLQKALKSLEKQTFKDFSVHVVINGLYTSLEEVISQIEYAGKIKITDLKEKKSAAIALNYGINNSDKPFIAMLMTDDEYYPEKLEKQILFFEENPECDLLATAAIACDHTNGKQIVHLDVCGGTSWKTTEQIASVIENINIIAGGTVMFRSSFFEKYNIYYEEKYKPGTLWPNYGRLMWEDWDMWIRSAKAGAKIMCLPERLYFINMGTSVER